MLFALFISLLADITTPTTYADDNYQFGSEKTEKKSLECNIKQNQSARFSDSCLCVNKKKDRNFFFFSWCAPFGYLYSFFLYNGYVIASIAYIHPIYGEIRTHDLLDVNLPP
jgi:hypothetical protein